jgi:hypothetical protein
MTERPDEIERDIAARREALAQTLDALQERAGPEQLAQAGAAAAAQEGERLLGAALRAARRNPLATAMVAAGLAWLAFGPEPEAPRGRGAGRGGASPPTRPRGTRPAPPLSGPRPTAGRGALAGRRAAPAGDPGGLPAGRRPVATPPGPGAARSAAGPAAPAPVHDPRSSP